MQRTLHRVGALQSDYRLIWPYNVLRHMVGAGVRNVNRLE